MTTIRQAQRAIDKAHVPLELVRGEGYHYFIYDVPARGIYETVSLYVPYTNTYSPEEWANQAGLVFIDMLDRLGDRPVTDRVEYATDGVRIRVRW